MSFYRTANPRSFRSNIYRGAKLSDVVLSEAEFIYSGSDDNTVKKIDSFGTEVWTFTGHTDRVFDVAVDSDGNVYSCSRGNTVKKIDSSGTEVWSFTGHTDRARSVVV